MLLGAAALAMWWDVAADRRAEFEDWHSHEHFRERMAIPGFRRGSRWREASGGDGFFVMYELEDYATLTSPRYLARLNDPTPWSARMMPHHRNMVRSQCRVLESAGGGIGGYMLTLRVSPVTGGADSLRAFLREAFTRLAERPGFAGGHLLRTETPDAAATTEQKIRGGDGVADWIVLVSGYSLEALRDIAAADLGETALLARGASRGSRSGLYELAYAVTPADFTGA